MINSITSITQVPTATHVEDRKKLQDKRTTIEMEKQEGYEPKGEEQLKKVTYDKPKGTVDTKTIAALKRESEKAHEQLKELVEQLLKRQGYTWDKIIQGDFDDIKVDDIAVEEAKALIAEDGPLGAEKTSDRIVDFAIAISGGDKTKLEELKAAIDKGFKEAEEMLGGLPEVSKRTYDLVMEKLDKWYQENE